MEGIRVPWHWRAQDNFQKLCVLGIELRSSGMVTSALLMEPILPALSCLFFFSLKVYYFYFMC